MKHLFAILSALCLLLSCKDRNGTSENSKQRSQEDVQKNFGFSDVNACIFSEIAYCDDPQQQLDKYLPGWKVAWNPNAVKGNHAFVAESDDTYVIAFRGSLISFTQDAFYNWIYNDL